MVERLSDYPFVTVRVVCDICQRQGEYRAVRLAAKLGPEATLAEVLDGIAFDCEWRRYPGQRPVGNGAKCGAHFPDLEGAPFPLDCPVELPAQYKQR